ARLSFYLPYLTAHRPGRPCVSGKKRRARKNRARVARQPGTGSWEQPPPGLVRGEVLGYPFQGILTWRPLLEIGRNNFLARDRPYGRECTRVDAVGDPFHRPVTHQSIHPPLVRTPKEPLTIARSRGWVGLRRAAKAGVGIWGGVADRVEAKAAGI